MNHELTAAALYSSHAEKLGLSWVAGRTGGARPIRPAGARDSSFETWAGFMKPVHPRVVQVLGPVEIRCLAGLEPAAHSASLERLFSERHTACIVVSDGQRVPARYIELADAREIPLLSSGHPGYKIISHLQHSLAGQFAEHIHLHGVFMEVLGIGVLLTGKSGVGKSEVALELINRSHRLIADDAPEFRCVAVDVLNGSCPDPLIGFLEVRGLGVLNIRAMFGDSAIKPHKNLSLIIELQRMSDRELAGLDRIEGDRRRQSVLDVEVPHVILPVVPGHNLAVLVEGAVRNHILRMNGYNAAEAFMESQRSLVLEGGP